MQHLEVRFKNGEVYYYPADERGWASGVRGGRRYLLVGYAMIPADEAERWRLVGPAPAVGPASIAEALAAGRCPACDRAFSGEGVSCHVTPAGGWVCNRGVEGAQSETPPDPAEVEDVVRWAEQQARRCGFVWFEDELPQRCEKEAGHDGAHERRRCPARAWLKGTSYSCETPASYPYTEHGNVTAGLMWSERTS